MCLAVPARVVERRGDEAVVDLHGNRIAISTLLTPEADAGDWVLIHAGFAIQKLAAAEAERTWAVLEDLSAGPAATTAPPMQSGSNGRDGGDNGDGRDGAEP